MTHEYIEYGNKLIAESRFASAHRKTLNDIQSFRLRYNYHSNWSMLMPIVAKLEAEGYKMEICRRRVIIRLDKPEGTTLRPAIVECKEPTKLQSVYNAVIEFIHKHDTNQLNP